MITPIQQVFLFHKNPLFDGDISSITACNNAYIQNKKKQINYI